MVRHEKSGTQLYRGCRLSSARRWPLAPSPDAGQEKHDESSGRDPGGASETPQLASKEDDEQRGGIDQAEPRAGGGEPPAPRHGGAPGGEAGDRRREGQYHQNAVQHFPRSFPAAGEAFDVKGHRHQ